MTVRPKVIKVTVGTELPSKTFEWLDGSGNIIDFSTGWTFTLRVESSPTPLVKTTGITGAATLPNITVDFAAGELDSLTPGQWPGTLGARRTADAKDRDPLRLNVWVYAP